MENTQIIHILHVALPEVQCHGEPLCQEVQCVEGFGLRFRDGWDVAGSGKSLEARETATGVLDYDALRFRRGTPLVEKERAQVVWVFGVSESGA